MDINERIVDVEERVEHLNFATEILQELKSTIKRLWIILIVILSLWAATIGGFVWYISQYDYIGYSQDGNGYNNVNVNNGGSVQNNNGTKSQNETQEER